MKKKADLSDDVICSKLHTDRITIFQGKSDTGKSKMLYNILAKMNTEYPVILLATNSVMLAEKPDPKNKNDLSLYSKLVLRFLPESRMTFTGYNITAFEATPTEYIHILTDILQRQHLEEKIICIDNVSETVYNSDKFLSLLFQIQQKFEVPIIAVITETENVQSPLSFCDRSKYDCYRFIKKEDFFSIQRNDEAPFGFFIAPNCQVVLFDEFDAFLHLNVSIDEIEHYDPVVTVTDGKMTYSTGKWLDRDTVEDQIRFTCMHEHCRHPAQGYPVFHSVSEMTEHVMEHLMEQDD